MSGTVQVVRIEDVQRLFPVTTELEDGQLWAVLGDLANEFRVGDVIELKEQRRLVAVSASEGWFGWDRRFKSKWEVIE